MKKTRRHPIEVFAKRHSCALTILPNYGIIGFRATSLVPIEYGAPSSFTITMSRGVLGSECGVTVCATKLNDAARACMAAMKALLPKTRHRAAKVVRRKRRD